MATPSAPQTPTKFATPASIVVDLILCAGVFAFLFWLLRPHVPSRDGFQIALWSGLTALCMTCVFWFCVQMIRVVISGQREERRGLR